MTKIATISVALALALAASQAMCADATSRPVSPGVRGCGAFRTEGYGPFDYRTRKDKLAMVEGFHFTPEVEMLIRGKSSTDIADDIEYTLDVFPNHHRALVAMQRLSERMKTPQPPGAHYTLECYFERAVRYSPDDEVARLLYANFLVKEKRVDEARDQLDKTEALAAGNAFTQFNLGLVYLELKDYDKALDKAHAAQELGLARPELADALKKAGKWREAAAPAAPAASAPASAAVSAAASAAVLP